MDTPFTGYVSSAPELPLSEGNASLSFVQIGCGFRVKAIRRREYVYFWHYEPRYGRSRQVYEYMGPSLSPRTARRLRSAMDAYFARAAEALRRESARQRRAATALVSRGRKG